MTGLKGNMSLTMTSSGDRLKHGSSNGNTVTKLSKGNWKPESQVAQVSGESLQPAPERSPNTVLEDLEEGRQRRHDKSVERRDGMQKLPLKKPIKVGSSSMESETATRKEEKNWRIDKANLYSPKTL
ncbi:hypothetical protein AMTR_s00071p00197650 [Amborella trichopoda]|uniref:Uncharacterized protein n=1 Tax=Amborella trichopoda TaxID=13333 RepID=U5DCY8_AMBTC|nr:hypothetical protein AMTR_s00071p00197650 [Amborella trichopoda]